MRLIQFTLSLLVCTNAAWAQNIPGQILHRKEMEGVEQLLLVRPKLSKVEFSRFEKHAGAWVAIANPTDAIIGFNGFAREGLKREGDGKTPTGVYKIGTAFGYAKTIETAMPYRQAMDNDYWVDDPRSPDYNKWVQGKKAAYSVEKMLRKDSLYKIGMVLEYNTNPVISGHGSAIFLHVWSGPAGKTTGCVAIEENALMETLRWLKPDKNPRIAIVSE